MPSERDKAFEQFRDPPPEKQQQRTKFPMWLLILAVIATMFAIPVLIILAIDLRRLFLD